MHEVADEIPVDVVRTILVLDEGSVDEDLGNPYLPELLDKDFEVVHELSPPEYALCVGSGTKGIATQG
jgi:hypothetical protein